MPAAFREKPSVSFPSTCPFISSSKRIVPTVMSFLNTHRLHWGSHHKISGNLHEHLDLFIHQETESEMPATEATSSASADTPTEMPSQIINPPSSQRELGS